MMKFLEYFMTERQKSFKRAIDVLVEHPDNFRVKTKVKSVKNQEIKNMNTLTFLKVKYTSLAAESKIIRKEERKALENARYIDKLTRKEDRPHFSKEDRDTYHELRAHRKQVVGFECRAAHIASTYLRGKPYEFVESKLDMSRYHCTTVNGVWYQSGFCHSSDNQLWKRVAELVQKYETSSTYMYFKHRRSIDEVYNDVMAWRLKHPMLQYKMPEKSKVKAVG